MCIVSDMRKEMFTPDAPGELRRLSGEYATRYGLMQYDTYSFVPNPLGDYPTLSPRVMGVVSRASMALARLSELGEDLPNPDMLRRPTMRREAQSTSALEARSSRWKPFSHRTTRWVRTKAV